MNTDDLIKCPVDKWYFKRMGLMTLMLTAFALWFTYDGFVGYPKKNKVFEKFEKFQTSEEAYKKHLDEKTSQESWLALAEKEGYELQDNNEPRTWATYSKENKLEGNPKKKPDSDIRQQKQFAIAFGLGAIGVLLTLLFNRKKTISSDSISWTTPKGKNIKFSDIYEIDKRKWDNKGLATIFYKENEEPKKVLLDDLKFTGAGKILDRIMANFSGDIIETVNEEQELAEDKATT